MRPGKIMFVSEGKEEMKKLQIYKEQKNLDEWEQQQHGFTQKSLKSTFHYLKQSFNMNQIRIKFRKAVGVNILLQNFEGNNKLRRFSEVEENIIPKIVSHAIIWYGH